MNQKLSEIDKAIGEAEVDLNTLTSELNVALGILEDQIEKEFSKLPAMAGKTGKEVGRAYQHLLREIERIQPARTRLKTINDLVEELEQARRNLLGEISDIRSARTAAKQRAVKGINKRLRGKIRITLIPDGLRQPLRNFLQGISGIGERKTEWVEETQDLTILGLVAAA